MERMIQAKSFCAFLMFLPAVLEAVPSAERLQYRVDYTEWLEAVDSSEAGKFMSGASWKIEPGFAFGERLRLASEHLLGIGANMIPFLVEEYRRQDARQSEIELLLDALGGINLIHGRLHDTAATPWPSRERFLEEWDAGIVASPDTTLVKRIRDSFASTTDEQFKQWKQLEIEVNVRATLEVRRYGVYSIPFILRGIAEGRDADELFAAFLIMTGQRTLYGEYIRRPRLEFPDASSKINLMADWWRRNASRFDQLEDLRQRIHDSFLAAHEILSKQSRLPERP